MNRRTLLLAAFAGLAPVPALAASYAEQIIAELRSQGYARIEVSRTLLGRTRIEADSAEHHREIIVNPRTGEILRDYSRRADGTPEERILDPGGRSDHGDGTPNSGGGTGSDDSSGGGDDGSEDGGSHHDGNDGGNDDGGSHDGGDDDGRDD